MKNKRIKLLVYATITMTIIYLLWRSLYTLPFGLGFLPMFLGICLLIAEITGMFEQIVHFYTLKDIRKPIKPEVNTKDYPTVDVYIATYNEPTELLYKTVNGCVNMQYPDRNKVKIYLCDDGGRDEVRELANHFGICYLAREEHEGAKAGNLNHALANSTGELVVTFDADMIPMSDFLMETVPYFIPDLLCAKEIEQKEGIEARSEREGKIGFIQTPQSFYNLDLFQYNLFSESTIPNEQDYFYRDIQLAKNKSNSVIYGGSNTVLSREALKEIGGFVTNVITEDFATGMLIQSKGYQCYAIDEVHASGLSPEDLENLVKQRRRWARGCIQTGRKLNILFRRGLNMGQKISYMSSISYWYDSIKRLVYILSPIWFSVFGITIFVTKPWMLAVFWLPMYALNNAALKRLSGNIRTTHWTNIYETIMFPLLLGDVLLEMFGISQSKFAVTKKGGERTEGEKQLRMAIPHGILAVLTIVGIIRSFYIIFTTGNVSILFLVFWLVLNLYNLTMAIFFMLGRKVFRKSERFKVEAECELQLEGKKIREKTWDLSEGGFSIVLERPEYISPEKIFEATLKENGYKAHLTARIVQVVEVTEGWKYAFMLETKSEEDYKQLLHIIHDRVPPLTKYIMSDFGYFEYLQINLTKRYQKQTVLSRKLPRITVDKMMECRDGMQVRVLDFNYQYVVVSQVEKGTEQLQVKLSDTLFLQLQYEKELCYQGKREQLGKAFLYRVLNEEVMRKEETITTILSLAKEYKQKEKARETRMQQEVEFDELSML